MSLPAPAQVPARDWRQRVLEVAKNSFGYDELRPGQMDAILSLLSGQDTLVVMPTGWGKSAVYQIAALLLDGPTVVVSPLISLQRDQVASLLGRGGMTAVSANSSQSRQRPGPGLRRGVVRVGRVPLPLARAAGQARGRRDAADGQAVPVRRRRGALRLGLGSRLPARTTCDSAPVIDQLGRPRVVALTATASPPVRTEIIERLRLRDAAQRRLGLRPAQPASGGRGVP